MNIRISPLGNPSVLLSLAITLTLGHAVSNAQTVLIDGTAPDYVNNGSFETTSDWWGGTATNLSADLGLTDGILLRDTPATPSDGSFYTVIATDASGNIRGIYLDTGYDLATGDQFDLSFYHGEHQGFEFNDTDTIVWQLFTTTTGNDSGVVQDVIASGTPVVNNSQTLVEESYSSIGTVTPAMAGDRLWIAFWADFSNGDYAALDEVNLTVIPEPSSILLLASSLLLVYLAARRR